MTNKNIIGSDFDQTIAYTFTPPEKGLGVRGAYECTIADIFGCGSVKVMDEFRSQSPREIATALSDILGESHFLHSVKRYHARHEAELERVMPEGAGAHIDWDTEHKFEMAVEVIIRRKLGLMLPNIGTSISDGDRWPHLTPHFKETWEKISKDSSYGTAIVSSGHNVFIERVFEEYDMPLPDVLITDDYMRRRGLSFRKPDIELWEIVLSEFRAQGVLPEMSVYIGDDRKVDGGLAQRAQIPFLHFVSEEKSPWYGHRGTFSDWMQAEDMLVKTLGRA